MKVTRLWIAFLPVAFSFLTCFAQTNVNEEQGLKPYESLHGGDLDSISMTNGGMVSHAPLASYPQRGNLSLDFSVYSNTKQWSLLNHCVPSQNGGQDCTWFWRPLPRGGLVPTFVNFGGGLPIDGAYVASSLDMWLQSVEQTEPPDPNTPNVTVWDWSLSAISPDGNVHQFGNGASSSTDTSPHEQFPMRSLDASGLLNLDGNTMITPNGTRFAYPGRSVAYMSSEPSSVTDANGNRVTIDSNTGAFTDTLGRVITAPPGVVTSDLTSCPAGTSSAKLWTVPGLAGGTRTFKFCYSVVSIYTSFNDGFDYPPTNNTLLTAIVLPDLTTWIFSYDHWGNVTHLGFPTGGSISYTYAIGPVSCSGNTTRSLVVTSRTVDANDGTGGHTWLYNFAGQITSGGYSGTAIVTSPEGNDTVHTITSPIAGGSCSLFDTQVQYYQGSHTTGTLMKTAATQYSGAANPMTSDAATAINVVPTQTTITWPDGHSSRAVSTFDSGTNETEMGVTFPVVLGSLLQKDEYDFSNTLARTTLNHYLWQDSATYKNNNLVSLPVSSTLCIQPSNCVDGTLANRVAQTTYGYDQTAVTASGVTTQLVAPPAGGNVRGNPTTVSHWLNTNNSFISATATYLDTGMKATSTDPLNHTTSYTYSSTFAGAYMTQTNLPDTQMPDTGAPIVHHVVSGNYDLNTGLLTSFTDENSQTFTYTYDNMLRPTQGNHPDGGQTIFTYPDANTVTRQRLITTGTYDSYTAKFDGLGRPYQTQQVTPSGTVVADTTYDTVGRVSTVSNPYYQGSNHATDPTYGVTQSQYDALSRVIKTIKQDGSFSTVKYNDPAGDGAGSTVLCTTAIDEAGKPRQSCADVLGRMVKVMEPNPASTATFATGSATVSGTEQQSGSSTSGTGSVTIVATDPSGQDQATCNFDSCPPSPLTWDTGTISITVNGVTKSTTYGHFSTASAIASALASAFHNDGSAPADATSSGATVTLTARATGSGSNYSFSAGSSSDDPADFTPPSFTTSASGAALTGGHDPGYDSGTVRITLNGTNYTVNFGQGGTTTSIATALASAVNADANRVANASSTGGTVSLTARTAGSVGNYSLAASYTWNSGAFGSPSFTTSTSASTLTNGKDAGAINNNPYVTTYQYNIRGDMLCVHQKATDTTADVACTGANPPAVSASWRQRFFTYDSLSRLLTANNPETNNAGTAQITYAYDNGGNLTSKTEPAPNQAWGTTPVQTVTINYTYDALNRLLDTTYTGSTTQSTSHRYDYSSFLGQTFTNPIGRQVAATAASNTISFFTSYDSLGRIANTVECTPGVSGCKTFTAGYDKLGDLTALGYPANSFSVTYGYDSAARLVSATDSSGVVYAQNPAILASGAMQEFTSPNFNTYKFHADYNSRLQPTEIWAGASSTSNLFDKRYNYNAPNTSQMNNGNIYTVTNVKDSTRTQTFTYDALNRLISAGDQNHWGNTYTYDAWGNLQKIPGTPAGENFQHAGDTNNHIVGYSYDAAGNLLNDGVNTFNYVYDAENRIVTAGSVTYTYDADGRRIKKSNGANSWYGPGGQVLAETDSSGNWTNYIFFGGQRLARNIPQPSPNPADIKYYVTDHLHSTAMFVDKTGTVLDDNDFYPWGGVVPGVGTTTSNNRYKFTGKERDTESGLDYFGARYYANVIGRFMSPDWAAKPTTVPYAEFGDPQSLNLYSYVRNSPIVRIDADGHTYAGLDGLDADQSNGSLPAETSDGHHLDSQIAFADNGRQAAEIARMIAIANSVPRREPLRTRIADDYHVDVKNHGGPHIDRVNKNGKLVGRYDENGNGIKHKGKIPPKIPNSDKEKFKTASDKLKKINDAVREGNVNEMAELIAEAPGVPKPPQPEGLPRPIYCGDGGVCWQGDRMICVYCSKGSDGNPAPIIFPGMIPTTLPMGSPSSVPTEVPLGWIFAW